MRPHQLTALALFAGFSAIWLAATIDPLMLMGSVCGTTLAEHCWRCSALAADLIILIAAAVQQVAAPRTARH